MNRYTIIAIAFYALCGILHPSFGQLDPLDSVQIGGEIVQWKKNNSGHSVMTKELNTIRVTSKKKFSSEEEQRLYRRYKYYAIKVYPYAIEAINIFRSAERESMEMSKRKRRKYYKQRHKELKEKFEDPLKDLSKTQGRILVHMIERELNTPLHYLIKDLRNGLHATYWSTLGGLYGYHLKKGYIRGEDPIMDMVLDDLDLSYKAY